MLKRVYLEITNVCNLACSFCPGTLRKKRFLSEEEFSALTAKLRGWKDYRTGDTAGMGFGRKHFFDKDTTEAIRKEGN